MTATTEAPRLIDFMYERMKHKGTGKVMEHRKLAHNTYGRLIPGGVAIKLHNTDVVIFRDDGTVTLSTGGWYTVTTKDRMNRWSGVPYDEREHIPRFDVWSNRGTWYVEIRVWDDELESDWGSRGTYRTLATHRFFDGITFDSVTGRLMNSEHAPDFNRIDAWNGNVERLIDRTFRKLKPEDFGRLSSMIVTAFEPLDETDWEGARLYCEACKNGGIDDVEHLLDHLEENEITPPMVIAAYHRFAHPNFVAGRDLDDAARGRSSRYGTKYHLRRWLRNQLKRGVAKK